MKILLAGIYESTESRKGGPTGVFSNLIDATSTHELEHEMDVVSESYIKKGSIQVNEQVTVRRVPIFNPLELLCVIKMVLKKRYNIINLHGVSDLNVLLAIIGKMNCSTIVYSVHGLILNEMRMGYRYPIRLLVEETILIKLSNYLVTVSNGFKEEIHKWFNYPNEKIHVVYNGISESWLQGSVDNCKAETTNPYLLFVGETNVTKGFDTLLEAFYLVKKKHENLKLIVIGEKPVDALLANARESISDIVFTQKEITKNTLKRFYKGAIALILPSRQESFGLVILEAFSQGVPVVVSNKVGAAEIFENEQHELVFKSGNATDLHRCLEIVLRDEDLRRRVALKGPLLASSRTWQNVLLDYFRLFEVVPCGSP